jgi:mRNA-degrading endonuclease RelE of RelBE toxin-antitoxin system
VISHVNLRFRRDFAKLPKRIQERARRAYRVFQTDSAHPSLEFKKLPPHDDIWSVRVIDQYRAVAQRNDDTII